MMVNQNGEPVQENFLYPGDLREGELEQALFLLLRHLNIDLVRTNATKHGNVELDLRRDGASV